VDDFTKDFAVPAALVLLGWLLGVLSPALIEYIRRDRDRKLICSAIRDDLSELRVVLAFTAFGIRSGSGQLDRGFLEWTKNVLITYKGEEDIQRSASFVSTLLAEPDQNIAAVAQAWAARRTGGHSLKKFYANTIDSNLPTIWQLSRELQTELLDISRRLTHLNEEVEQAQYYFRLTFECTGQNHSIANQNLASSYRNVADMACRVVDRIDAIRNLSR
jgi:hypothetical protein